LNMWLQTPKLTVLQHRQSSTVQSLHGKLLAA